MNRMIAYIAATIVMVACTDKHEPSPGEEKEVVLPGIVETYNWSREVKRSSNYDVTVQGVSQFVIKTPEPDICTFGCDDSVVVIINTYSEKIETAAVRPLNKHHHFEIKNDQLIVHMAPYDRICVEINGNIKKPLFLFANPQETDKPSPDDPTVRYFKAGEVYNAGTFSPSSGQTVYIEGGAWVNGNIHILNADNVKVDGMGLMYATPAGDKPMFINKSSNVSVKNIIVLNVDFWTTLAAQSHDLVFDNYKPIATASTNGKGHENDALDILGCQNVEVKRTFSYCHDDAICVKSEKWLYKGEVKNVTFTDCICWNYDCGTSIEMGVELNQNVSDVHFKDIYAIHSGGNLNASQYRAAIGIKNTAGGTVSNLTYENIYLEDIKEFGIYIACYKGSASIGEGVEYSPGLIKDVKFKNIVLTKKAPYGNVVRGYDADHRLTGIEFKDVFVEGIKLSGPKGLFGTITMADVTLE